MSEKQHIFATEQEADKFCHDWDIATNRMKKWFKKGGMKQYKPKYPNGQRGTRRCQYPKCTKCGFKECIMNDDDLFIMKIGDNERKLKNEKQKNS